jgi:uncharacterized protein (DUF486 family)
MLTILPLFCSNTFMTIAWYGDLRFRDRPVLQFILVSWLIAFAKYCFQVPANRIGYGYQLKIVSNCQKLWTGRMIRRPHSASYHLIE